MLNAPIGQCLGRISALGIDFVSLHEGVDTSTPNGRLVFGIFASISEFEKKLIRSRVIGGLAAAKAKAKRLGRPQVLSGTPRLNSRDAERNELPPAAGPPTPEALEKMTGCRPCGHNQHLRCLGCRV